MRKTWAHLTPTKEQKRKKFWPSERRIDRNPGKHSTHWSQQTDCNRRDLYFASHSPSIFWTVLFSSDQFSSSTSCENISSKIPSYLRKRPEKDTEQNIDACALTPQIKRDREHRIVAGFWRTERETDLQVPASEEHRNQPADMAPKSRKKKAHGKY